MSYKYSLELSRKHMHVCKTNKLQIFISNPWINVKGGIVDLKEESSFICLFCLFSSKYSLAGNHDYFLQTFQS